MNYKKKLTLSLAAVFCFHASAEDEFTWGMSIGYEKIDYGITLENTDAGTSSSDIVAPNTISEGSMSYGAVAIALDMRFGNHSFSVKSANGDSDDFMPSDGFPFAGWKNVDSNERSETSLNYSYKINSNWSVAGGTYFGENEREFTHTKTFPARDGNTLFNWDTTELGMQTSESEGTYIAAVYQDQLAKKWFWYGKLGYQTSTFNIGQKYNYAEQAVATDAWAGTQAQLVSNFTNGTGLFEWDIVYAVETEGSAAVLGLGLVYVITPIDTVTFGYERKNYSYDKGDVVKYTYTGLSGNSSGVIDDATTGTTFDEEADYLTITYRHQF